MPILSENNRLSNYIKFTEQDKFLAEYIDYLGFYGSYDKLVFYQKYASFFSSDNGSTFNYGLFNIQKEKNWIFINCSYLGYVVNVSRILQCTIGGKEVLKVDLYGKGLLALNSLNIWSEYESLLSSFSLHKITVTRIDYAVDCEKMNFRKTNKLNYRISGRIKNKDNVEYQTYGRKGKSAHFIRYYDKKAELTQKQTLGLYPQYWYIPTVMRYELQVNSEGLDEHTRNIKIKDLSLLANFGKYLDKKSPEYHQKRLHFDEDQEDINSLKIILHKLYKSKNKDKLYYIQAIVDDYLNGL